MICLYTHKCVAAWFYHHRQWHLREVFGLNQETKGGERERLCLDSHPTCI